MATLSASTSYPSHQEDYYQNDIPEGSYGGQDGAQEATLEGWRDIAQAIKKVTALLNVDEEVEDLAVAERAVAAKENERRAIQAKLSSETGALQRDLKKAKLDALRPQNQPTPEGHLAEVDRLEREYAQSGKQLAEAEASVGKTQSELARWKVEKEEVGRMEVGDEGVWADGKVIRLKLMKDAGFDLIHGQGNSANKILIRDETKSDIHTVSLDNSRSKTHNANFIWGLAGE